MIKVLELFAGTRSISKSFEKRNHLTYSIEWNKDFENITLYEDINKVTSEDIIKFCDKTNKHVLDLIKRLKPKLYFIENPRGGLRKMDFMKNLNRYTVTYCQYGDFRMKPTDIWTNHPNPKFKKPCKNGDKCHEPAPRGSRAGTQRLKNNKERSVIPKQLCDHIVDICEEIIGGKDE